MPNPKLPCGEGEAADHGVPVESETRVTIFGERLGEPTPSHRKLPPEHGSLPAPRFIDRTRVLNRTHEESRTEGGEVLPLIPAKDSET
jgi:hypothetical protein